MNSKPRKKQSLKYHLKFPYCKMIPMQDFQIYIPFEKSLSPDGELKLFGGIASSSSVDRDMERMDKAVLSKIASGLRKNSTVFFNHDTKGLGVGTVTNAEVRGEEVYIDVMPTKAPGMADVVTQIKEGILKSFSIGGRILDYEHQFDEKLGKKVRVIKDVDCYEVSVVGVPSNKDATIMSYIAKSFEGDKLAEENEAAKAAPASAAPTVENQPRMFKCAKCGEMNKVEDPAMGPHEDGKKAAELLDTPEFKKVFDEFGEKVSSLEKGYNAKIAEYETMLKAANARIDELHKSVDSKIKSLETEEQAILHKKAEEEKKPKDEGSFALFPKDKKYF